MLENTFIHIPGISEKKEFDLWKEGIRNWDLFLELYSEKKEYEKWTQIINESKYSLKNSDAEFFAKRIEARDQWRCFGNFKTVYLDIETTGLSPLTDYATVIGIFDGKTSSSFVHGINMDEFGERIKEYDLVVTFNGSLFDLPFIRKKMPQVTLPKLHIDLRFLFQNLGIYGGLKKIEEKFGYIRTGDLAGLTGYDAVKLWRAYKSKNDKNALDKLIRYNIADISNLEKLLQWAYNQKRKKSGIDDL